MTTWQPSASVDALRQRAALNATIRSFFAERGVMEVETPILSIAGNTEPNIESFQTEYAGRSEHGDVRRWLRTSPEFFLKRLLAAGVGDCYELGRVFRNGESGISHNPEFTMLEWYRVGWQLEELIDECVALVQTVASRPDLPVHRYTYADLYLEYCGIDVDHSSDKDLRRALGDTVINADGVSRDDWLDLLMTHKIQSAMPSDAIISIRDFPATQSALAKVIGNRAQRFELYWGGREIANGYHELTDAKEQMRRFERDAKRRLDRGQPEIAMDQHLLHALPNMPECCGVAIGVDRLLIVLMETPRIADTVAFDFERS